MSEFGQAFWLGFFTALLDLVIFSAVYGICYVHLDLPQTVSVGVGVVMVVSDGWRGG